MYAQCSDFTRTDYAIPAGLAPSSPPILIAMESATFSSLVLIHYSASCHLSASSSLVGPWY
jgi:hypothetical protein